MAEIRPITAERNEVIKMQIIMLLKGEKILTAHKLQELPKNDQQGQSISSLSRKENKENMV